VRPYASSVLFEYIARLHMVAGGRIHAARLRFLKMYMIILVESCFDNILYYTS
jgi:hypothetical protein